MEKQKFYITTPIYYPSDKLHIGHTYCTVATDAMARYKRLTGCDVMFLTGTDEHGQKIEEKAKAAGITPKQYVDHVVSGIKDLWKLMNVSNDRFIRTTDSDHKISTDELWRRMEANGDIYLAKYSGWYSVRDEAFYGEEETTLQPDGTRLGGQGTPVEWVEEESYFFRLKAYQDRLLALYRDTLVAWGKDC